jgi:D-tyrosyl-tRNA(Tyr) deacylase
MKTVIQRVSSASVTVNKTLISSIEQGLLILVGFTHNDTSADIEAMTNKILNLRIFNDGEGVMNLSIRDIRGEILLVSQFTLYAQCNKGNRPSYIQSAPQNIAEPLYEQFANLLGRMYDLPVKKGIFGADMQVALVNDGPVTIML